VVVQFRSYFEEPFKQIKYVYQKIGEKKEAHAHFTMRCRFLKHSKLLQWSSLPVFWTQREHKGESAGRRRWDEQD